MYCGNTCLITGHERCATSSAQLSCWRIVPMTVSSSTLLKHPWARLPIRPMGAAFYSAWPWPLTSLFSEVSLPVKHIHPLLCCIFATQSMKANSLFIFSSQWQLLWFLQLKWMYLYLRLLYLCWETLADVMRDYCNYNICKQMKGHLLYLYRLTYFFLGVLKYKLK